MSVAPGTRIGPYEVISMLGAGGMGEVYRARDVKLNRVIAIKILPETLAHDTERLARFEREARVLATLNHPNIGQIHGFEESDGVKALVMELVEGPTLAERIAQGPIPLDEALPIAKQIAEALEAAHEQGIIHRDLKPANIKVRPDGTVKVLDFGLAKVLEPVGAAAGDATAPPTITSPAMTAMGLILGTAAYMSPEQAKGRQADKRSDIWAFGAVLYEMLTGRRAFGGDDLSDTLAAVLKIDPDWSLLPADVPPHVRTLVQRCLAKVHRERIADISTTLFVMKIDEALSGGSEARTQAQAREPYGLALLHWALLGCGLFAAGGIGVFLGVRFFSGSTTELPLPFARLNVDLGAGVVLGSAAGQAVILAPNGQRLIFVSQGRLWGRRLDQPNASEFDGTDGAFAPFFSRDGRWVAFFAEGKLKKVPADGGSVITLCDAPAGRGGTWGQDGNIVAALTPSQGLSRIPAAGGQPEPFTTLAPGEFTHRWPQFVSGGSAVLFTSHTGPTNFDTASIELVSLADGRRQKLQQNGTFGRYFPESAKRGYLTYINRGVLYAVPFDTVSLQSHGNPSPVLEQVSYSSVLGSAQIDFAENGSVIYRSAGTSLHWLEASGRRDPLRVGEINDASAPAMSGNGNYIALIQKGDLWVHNLAAGTRYRLVSSGDAGFPVWTPDGEYIIFETPAGMSWVRSDGGKGPQPLTRSPDLQSPSSISSDGRTLAFMQWVRGASNAWDIWTLRLEEDASGLRAGRPQPFLQTPADERTPAFSGDGRWLAYSSNESGVFQVFVRAFPDIGRRWLISSGGDPRWPPKGGELFFRSADDQIMTATLGLDRTSVVSGPPRLWFDTRVVRATASYAVSPDGKRVIALLPVDASEDTQNDVTFLFNAVNEMRRLVSQTH